MPATVRAEVAADVLADLSTGVAVNLGLERCGVGGHVVARLTSRLQPLTRLARRTTRAVA
jgi:hypothetical protein